MMRCVVVIPAQAGTQLNKGRREASALFASDWAPAFAGVTKEARA